MQLPFSSSVKKPEEMSYEKMIDENENNAKAVEEPKNDFLSTIVDRKIETCCLNPKKCCVIQNPVSQKVIEVIKNRFN